MTPHIEVYREITLTQGQVTRVTERDFEKFGHLKWFAWWNKKTRSYYARRSVIVDGKKLTISLAREILGLTIGDGLKADHINHDTLNNVFTSDPVTNNLRIASNAQNSQNCRKQINNKSGFKNVSYESRRSKWVVYVGFNGQKKFCGYYDTKQKANAAARIAVERYHGNFGYTEG